MKRRRAIVVLWYGKRRPTAAELRALGRLPPGRYAAGPRRSNPASSSAAAREYERFHWGRRPRETIRVVPPSTSGGLYEIGRLRRVEYETTKGRERAIWYHDFSRPFPRLTATLAGRLGPIIGGRARVEPRGIVG
jgi:hypothetical protein